MQRISVDFFAEKIFVCLLFILPSFAYSATIEIEKNSSADFSIYTKPHQLVEVEAGRRLNLVCIGKGSPTIIFDIGVGDPAGDWALVQPTVAKSTRTCSYDRAGIGFSDDGSGDGSSAEIVADLKRLLTTAKIAPPFILVGQSYGGMNMRLYYYTHPDDVVGLVLVDPSHEEQGEGYRMLSPRQYTRTNWAELDKQARLDRASCIEATSRNDSLTDEEIAKCIAEPPMLLPTAIKPMYLKMQYSEKFQRAQGNEETAVFAASVEQLRHLRRGLGELPIIVLSRSPETKPLREWETQRLRDTRYQLWLDLHRSVADSSSRGEHRVIAESDHHLQLSQPAAVVTAIRDVMNMHNPKAGVDDK